MQTAAVEQRWELYKLLAEPLRLRLLALTAVEVLSVGELAELLGESQSNVSRHLKMLRGAGIVEVRKQGTRVYVSLGRAAASDPVVEDALRSGQALCSADGTLDRVAAVVAAREVAGRDFFDKETSDSEPVGSWPPELAAYLSALAPLISRRQLAIDVGTGHGSMLEVLAPVFERVVGVDRSNQQLSRARKRLMDRQYGNVELIRAALGDAALDRFEDRCDAVFAARVVHHAPRPAEAFTQLAQLVAPGGAVIVVDYVTHEDERLRNSQADVWLGFDPDELQRFAASAGLVDIHHTKIPSARCGTGPDGHLDWQVVSARKPEN